MVVLNKNNVVTNSNAIDMVEEGRELCIFGSDNLDWIRDFNAKMKLINLEMIYNVKAIVDTIYREKLCYSLYLGKMKMFWFRLEAIKRSVDRQNITVRLDEISSRVAELLKTGGNWAVIGGGFSNDAIMIDREKIGELSIGFLSVRSAFETPFGDGGIRHHNYEMIIPFEECLVEKTMICGSCKRSLERFVEIRIHQNKAAIAVCPICLSNWKDMAFGCGQVLKLKSIDKTSRPIWMRSRRERASELLKTGGNWAVIGGPNDVIMTDGEKIGEFLDGFHFWCKNVVQMGLAGAVRSAFEAPFGEGENCHHNFEMIVPFEEGLIEKTTICGSCKSSLERFVVYKCEEWNKSEVLINVLCLREIRIHQNKAAIAVCFQTRFAEM
ncbi:calcium-dependent phospholipid-binding protein [Striga asiatica]|uniref:Calcium-dependent phospholipid-binding protein n=1 Tax=Striga asiatica TaxID=4170 RepID=A0A5A7RFQ1_STRAF|nr:calcium-dependent phospholipid-binding protein [Striga asiatica]